MEQLRCHGLKRPENNVQVVGDKIDVISDIKEVTIKDKKTGEESTQYSYIRTRYSTSEYIATLGKGNSDQERLEQLEQAFGELADMVLTGGNV